MSDFYDPGQDEALPECKERYYWHKRFNFASWLFLILALYGIFFTDNFIAMFFALVVSTLWRVLDSWNNIRHLKWHVEREDGGGDMSL